MICTVFVFIFAILINALSASLNPESNSCVSFREKNILKYYLRAPSVRVWHNFKILNSSRVLRKKRKIPAGSPEKSFKNIPKSVRE